nr:multiple epidermal growth factor-like domains protein 8 [Chelonoidis abingdonii]
MSPHRVRRSCYCNRFCYPCGSRWADQRGEMAALRQVVVVQNRACRTAADVFSSQMFRFHLERWQWERVVPAGGKAPAAAGHSMVFHPPSRALLVYGGHRPSTARGLCRGGSVRLILSPSNCFLCEEYRDCHACSADPFCEWQVNSSKKGDLLCSRRGRQPHAIRAPHDCPVLCHQRSTCTECLSNSSQCAWCQSTRSCFFFAAYLAKYPYGECRGWYDSQECGHGRCSGSPDYACECELGWTSGPGAGGNGSAGGAQCSVDCGCHFHSSCEVGGPGVCDECQDWTHGEHCHLCRPGSFGDAMSPGGCQACECNGHGLPELGHCHGATGACYCAPPAEGPHCERCAAGFYGDPRNMGTCYRACDGRSLLANLSDSGSLGSRRAGGVPGDLAHCLWVLSASPGLEPCPPAQPCPTISLTLQPDLSTPCMHSYVYAFDGLPAFLDSGEIQADRTLIGAFCGQGRAQPLTVEATSGGCCQRRGRQLGPPGVLGTARGWGCPRAPGWGLSRLRVKPGRTLGQRLLQGTCHQGQEPARLRGLLGPTSERSAPCSPRAPPQRVSLDGAPGEPHTPPKGPPLPSDSQPVSDPDGLLVMGDPAQNRACEHRDQGPAAKSVWGRPSDPPVPSQETDQFPQPSLPPPVAPLAFVPLLGQQVPWAAPGPPASPARPSSSCQCWALPPAWYRPLPHTQCWPPSPHSAAPRALTLPLRLSQDTASRFLHRLGHTMVEGPEATLWMFGGLSLRQGLLGTVYRYSIPERRWTQMLAGTEDGGPGPSPRYFHAAAYVPARQAMVVLGGLAAGGVASDCWVLNLTTLQWRQQQDPLLPAVAGHTLTPRRGTSLLVIGGYSPADGFNKQLLEYGVESERWQAGMAAGTPPTGLYGHSAVYHEGTDAVYVFGGQRFHVETVSASPELYSLHCPSRTWSLLAPAQGPKPLSHFFHAAAVLQDTMVVVGGCTETKDFTSHLLLYQLNCNTWILPNQTGPAVVDVPMNESVAHAVAAVGGRIYVSGGFSGVALGRMVVLTVPSDPCLVFPGPDACNHSSASCTWCRSSCLSADAAERLGCPAGAAACFPTPRSADECRRLRTCSECLARHPHAMSQRSGTMAPPQCKWCTNCPEGACIGSAGSCTSENDCRINQREIFVASNCSEISCEAADCPACTASGKCMWTRQFKRTGMGMGGGELQGPGRRGSGAGGGRCLERANHTMVRGGRCLERANHTMGAHCEKCRPLFVGSALNGGTCRPCRAFCRGNSDVCISREELVAARRDPARFPLEPSLVPSWVAEGPAEDVAICVSCQNNSFGEKCESCLHGYFLLEGRCTRCQCNGHADTCNEVDGTGCPCQNNTETGPCQNSAQADKKDCYKYQCASAGTLTGATVRGTPVARLIVSRIFCFDPTSQSNCLPPPPLPHLARAGRQPASFRGAPKFTTVDTASRLPTARVCLSDKHAPPPPLDGGGRGSTSTRKPQQQRPPRLRWIGVSGTPWAHFTLPDGRRTKDGIGPAETLRCASRRRSGWCEACGTGVAGL